MSHNESTFPSGTGSNEYPAGVPSVVFGGENVGVPADEEGDSVATPFYPRGIDPGTFCAANIVPEPKSECLLGDPKERRTVNLMKMKIKPSEMIAVSLIWRRC